MAPENPTFVEYVLVASQGAPKIERFVKQSGVWTLSEDAGPGDTQRLSSVGAALEVDAIYRGLLRADGTLRVV